VAEDGTLLDGDYVQDRPKVAVVRTDPLAVGVLLALSVLLATGIAFVLTHYNTAREKAQAVIPVPTRPPATAPQPIATTSTVALEAVNTTSVLPVSWRTARRAPTLPTGVSIPEIVYTNTEQQCTLVYVPFAPRTEVVDFVRTATPTDVFSDRVLKGRIEYYSASTTRGEEHIAFSYTPLFYDNGRNDNTNNAWVLFAHNLTPPNQTCIDDLALLIQSEERAYDEYRVSAKKRGTLFIETHDPLGTLLLYTAEPEASARQVGQLDIGNIFRPTLVNTTLYYVGTDGHLKVYELFDISPPQTLPLPLTQDESVHDFVVSTTSVEYLSGNWCRDDSARCTLTRARYNITTASTTVLETEVVEPDLPTNETYARIFALTVASGSATSSTSSIPGFVTARVPIRVK